MEDGDRVENAKTGAHSSLGVVAVSDGSTEHCHHGVADELLEHAAVRLDLLARGVVVAAERVADILRIRLVRRRREPLQIDEQHRDELPLLPKARRLHQRGSARGAVEGVGRRASPASGTRAHRVGRRLFHVRSIQDRTPRLCDTVLQGHPPRYHVAP